MRRVTSIILVGCVVACIVVAVNYLLVFKPLTDRLTVDPRNAGIDVWAHYRYGIDSSTIVLDLRRIDGERAPVDLWRAAFQCAAALKASQRQPTNVLLQHRGRPVFLISGDDFVATGAAVDGGENPVYVLRTLPEKLRQPDGTLAYGTWTGGLLGVLAKQMGDLTDATRVWATGATPNPSRQDQ